MGKSSNVNPFAVLKDAFAEIAEERSVLITLWLGAILIGFFSLIKPLTVQIAINNLTTRDVSQILSLVAFFALFLFLNVATYMVVSKLEQVFYRFFSITRAYHGVFSRDLLFRFADEESAEIRKRKIHFFLDLAFQNAQQVPVAAATIPPILIQVAFGLFYISLIHPFLAGAALILVALIYAVIAFGSPRALSLAVEYHDAKQDIVLSTADAAASGHDDVPDPDRIRKAITATLPLVFTDTAKQELIGRLQSKQARFLGVVSGQSRVLITAIAIGNVALLGLGMWLIFMDQMTIAQLVAAEVAYSPALFAALQSSSSLSTTYDVLSNLHLMRRLRQNEDQRGEKDKVAEVALPEVPASVIGKTVRTERAFVLLGISAVISASLILIYAPWVQTIRMEGQIIPLDASAREQAIESPYEGRLVRALVGEGDTVTKGQKIAEIGNGKQLETILAPRAGRIVATTAYPGSSYLEKGEPVFRFLPSSDERIIRFAMPVKDGYLVNVGDQVFLQFPSWPSVQFYGWPSIAVGAFQGRVHSVAVAPGPDGLLTIDVAEAGGSTSHWPNEKFAGIGTAVQGHVQLATVPLWFELWRSVNGFPREYRHPSARQADSALPASQTPPLTDAR